MIRIGQGFDVHKFEEGRPLIIGGITIPHERGLQVILMQMFYFIQLQMQHSVQLVKGILVVIFRIQMQRIKMRIPRFY